MDPVEYRYPGMQEGQIDEPLTFSDTSSFECEGTDEETMESCRNIKLDVNGNVISSYVF